MAVKYLLDTNICIYLIKQQPTSVAERFALCSCGDVAMSAITFAELQHGAVKHGKQKELIALAAAIPVLPFESNAAEHYAYVALSSTRQRDALDKLIAGHALALNAILVTNNPSDFIGYTDLKIENWVA